MNPSRNMTAHNNFDEKNPELPATKSRMKNAVGSPVSHKRVKMGYRG